MARLITSILLFLFLSAAAPPIGAHNTTHILAKYPSFSTFSRLLSETGVVKEVDTRSSVTLLLVADTAMSAFVASVPGGADNLLLLADVLRYHCILQYLDTKEIRSMANATGVTLPTLYQTTGRAPGTSGFIKVAVSPRTKVVRIGVPDSDTFNASMLATITTFPYNVSYLQVDHIVVPEGLQGSAAARPALETAAAALKKLGNFNTFLDLLDSTGVGKALKAMSAVTVLAPPDSAFASAPPLSSLRQAQRIQLLQYHCIPTYFTFGSLQAVAAPLSTLASTSGAGKFALNVSSTGKDALTFRTGVNNASVSDTVVDDPPVALYIVDRVLLPPEIFAAAATSPSPAPSPSSPSPSPSPSSLSPSPLSSPSPSPELAPSPSPSPELTPSPSPSPELTPSPAPLAASPPAPPAVPASSPEGAFAPAADEKSGAAATTAVDRPLLVSALVAAAAVAVAAAL